MADEHQKTSRALLDQKLRGMQRGLENLDAEDASIERLHQLRVAVRECESAMFLCRGWLRKRERKWLSRKCKAVRDLSNEVRDCDVVLGWLDTQAPEHSSRKALVRQKAAAQRRLFPLVARLLKKDRFRRHRKQLKHAASPGSAAALVAQLLKLVGRFTEQAGEALNDYDQLHRWRISGKKLRYALSFLAELGAEAEVHAALGALKELQDRLGEVVDEVNRQRLLGQCNPGDRLTSQLGAGEDIWSFECHATICAGAFQAVAWYMPTEQLANTNPTRQF